MVGTGHSIRLLGYNSKGEFMKYFLTLIALFAAVSFVSAQHHHGNGGHHPQPPSHHVQPNHHQPTHGNHGNVHHHTVNPHFKSGHNVGHNWSGKTWNGKTYKHNCYKGTGWCGWSKKCFYKTWNCWLYWCPFEGCWYSWYSIAGSTDTIYIPCDDLTDENLE